MRRIVRSGAVMLAVAAPLALWGPIPAGAGTPVVSLERGGPLPTLAPVLKRVIPGVVSVAVRGRIALQRNPLFEDPFFRRFFNIPQLPREREFRSAGSGVIVDAAKGYIITNNHVIAKADQITVILQDGRRLKARLVGTDPETDVAVLQVRARRLTAVPLGDSDALQVGDFVVAVGNPFGLSQTVTSGIVSALGRTGLGIEGYEEFIQTDASINPGNSGGSLVNLRGELVGINTAIVGPAGGNVGIGFAIPVNMAKAVMNQLVAYGEVHRGRLGVVIQDLTPDIAEALGIGRTGGAVVARVERGSPAAKSGLKVGDVVVAINGEPIRNGAQLRNRVGLARPGEQLTLEVLRDGRRLVLTAKLAARRQAAVEAGSTDPRLAGAVFAPIAEGSRLYGRVEGVEVVRVQRGSPAWMNGLRKGDVIVAVNRRKVTTPEELLSAARANRRVLALNIIRGGAALLIVIE